MNNKEIEMKTDKVLQDLNIDSYPISIIDIAKHHGFKVYEQYLSKKISGMIMVNESEDTIKNPHNDNIAFDSNKVIIINKYDIPMRRRFTIAHELAHFFLHKSETDKLYAHRDEDGIRTQNERDANTFASSLLMPRKMVIESVSDFKESVFGSISNSILEDYIAKEFKVSLSAARVRLQQLNLFS